MTRTKISENEFRKICEGLLRDRAVIIKHNPIGSEEETLLWMLMSILISFLSIKDDQVPCFPGKPDASTYRKAIDFLLSERRVNDFDPDQYIAALSQQNVINEN